MGQMGMGQMGGMVMSRNMAGMGNMRMGMQSMGGGMGMQSMQGMGQMGMGGTNNMMSHSNQSEMVSGAEVYDYSNQQTAQKMPMAGRSGRGPVPREMADRLNTVNAAMAYVKNTTRYSGGYPEDRSAGQGAERAGLFDYSNY